MIVLSHRFVPLADESVALSFTSIEVFIFEEGYDKKRKIRSGH